MGGNMILKMILVVLTISPAISYAVIEESSLSHKEFVFKDESCQHDLKSLAESLCGEVTSELKEIHRDQFRMHTQGENSLDEWMTFINESMGLVKVHRYTDYNDISYDARGGYCFIKVSCYN